MARERRTKRLSDKLEITVQQLPAMKAMRLFHRLSRMIAPALAAAGKGKGDSVLDIDLGNLSEAAVMLFDRFSADDLEDITKELFAETTVTIDGKEQVLMPVFDMVFGGRMDLVAQSLGFALEANFGNLLAPIREALAARVADQGGPRSMSPKTSELSGQPTV